MADYQPNEFALPNPSPGSGLVTDVDGKPVATMPTAPNPGPVAAPAPKALTYTLNTPTKPSDTSLRYPGDIGEATDYMIFEFFKYKPPFGKGRELELLTPHVKHITRPQNLKIKQDSHKLYYTCQKM